MSECVGLTSHSTHNRSFSETGLSRQSNGLVLTTKNNQTQHYIHQKHKRETEKTALANKTKQSKPKASVPGASNELGE